ncbi:phosphorylcholine phosphatase [Dactylonectria estremocensis]|uniref:Phosphorylcholine phosphatase n=1 Tax=Dactylonectria estremocensis TaxID=1079267 RepID=A0A9P9DMX0_9HYPO|nr:phosphorylcholine phosphatase [Dactylonectria estremocensis]
MKTSTQTIVAALCLFASYEPAHAKPSYGLAGPELKHWPKQAAKSLNTMIARNAHKGRYAVFDMDNTSYQYDVEESLLPFLENKGVLTRDTMDQTLKLIPFQDTATHAESLYSYYNRLCDIDLALCYPWAAQIFSGISLSDLKVYVDELMALEGTISTTYYEGDVVTTTEVNPPKIFEGQIELYNRLMANGIEVYVVSASSEEVVRMVASDPKYGYNVKPENVIGVTLVLKNETGGITTARKQIEDGTYTEEANLDSVMTPYLWAPAPWKAGKWAAILTYIDEWKKPILVGGDTPLSDGPMLFHGVDVARGGIHLWINRKDAYLTDIKDMMKEFAKDQKKEGVPVTANKNWVIVKPADIHA